MENSYTKWVELQDELTKKIIRKDKNVNNIVLEWHKTQTDKSEVLLCQGIKFFHCRDKEFHKMEIDIKKFIDNYFLVLFDNRIFPETAKEKLSIYEKNEIYKRSLFNYKCSFDNTSIYNNIEQIEDSFHSIVINYNITCSLTDSKFFFLELIKQLK